MLGAVLDRPVVGLTSVEFTDKIWSLDEVKKMIRNYNIRYILLLFELFDITDRNQQFLLELKSGDIPSWLAVKFFSESVALYEINTRKL